VVRGQSSETAPRMATTAGRVFWALPFVHHGGRGAGSSRVCSRVLLLQKSAGDGWWWRICGQSIAQVESVLSMLPVVTKRKLSGN